MIKEGETVCFYEGELLSYTEGKRRERIGTCYLFFFKHKDRSWCIDATAENFTFGRLINHSQKHANVKPFACEVQGQPSIGFRAQKDIPPNNEILYPYGERDTDILRDNPWLLE